MSCSVFLALRRLNSNLLGSSHGIVSNVLNGDIKVSEFKLRLIPLGKA